MDNKRPHQAHAAFCRHAAAIREQAAYWLELDSQYHTFLEEHPEESLQRFCACQRQKAMKGRADFRASTTRTWLRSWRDQRESASKLNEGQQQ